MLNMERLIERKLYIRWSYRLSFRVANERAAVSRAVLELSVSGLARRMQVDQVFVDSGGGSRYGTESLHEV
jgi:hypothetical protein